MPIGRHFRKRALWAALALAIPVALMNGAAAFLRDDAATRSAFAALIDAHRDSVAIAAYTVDANGDPVEDGHSLFHNADLPLVLASTMKTVILAAYADAVADGAIDPKEKVGVADLERHYLPGTDGDAHASGLKRLGLKVGARGFAQDQDANVTLDDLAAMMIHFSSNNATDLLIDRLGQDRIRSVMAKAGLDRHSPMRPDLTLGVGLLLTNHDQPYLTMDEMRALVGAVTKGDTSRMDALARKYRNDQGWRATQIQATAQPATSPPGFDVWAYQTLASELFPKGTARTYAAMMGRIMKGRFISPEVSRIMREKLETAPFFDKLQHKLYARYGAKHGATAGVLTVVSYMVPKQGPLAGKDRVVVVLTNKLPMAGWIEQYRKDGIDHLSLDLAQATGTFQQLRDIR